LYRVFLPLAIWGKDSYGDVNKKSCIARKFLGVAVPITAMPAIPSRSAVCARAYGSEEESFLCLPSPYPSARYAHLGSGLG
jgi:hypothetical protein